MPSLAEQEATLNQFIQGWKKWSTEEMLASWAESATQKALPFSLGHPARTRAQVEETLPFLQRVVTNYELKIHEIVQDVTRGKAVVYAISKGSTPFGDWTNEYAVFITFDESRQKITKIEEMVDSAFMNEFFPKFQDYLRQQQGAAAPKSQLQFNFGSVKSTASNEMKNVGTRLSSHLIQAVGTAMYLSFIQYIYEETIMPTHTVLGATGNTGRALIETLLQNPDAKINAFCRNRRKLIQLLPQTESNPQIEIFEGSISDISLLASAIQEASAVFLVISTNDNVPGYHVGQDVAINVIRALEKLKLNSTSGGKPPKLILLSSATIDDQLSRHTPYILRRILLLSASNVYNDLRETERILRAEQSWLTTIFIKPGALTVDKKRGHALSFSEESSPLSYLDLAAGMIEAADAVDGRFDMQNVGVVNTNGRAKFPSGTPLLVTSPSSSSACTDFLIPVNITSQHAVLDIEISDNWDVEDYIFNSTRRDSLTTFKPIIGEVNASAEYRIGATFCTPKSKTNATGTALLLTHGPDPIADVQFQPQVEILSILTNLLKQPHSPYTQGIEIAKIVHVGHSFGSFLTLAAITTNPENFSDAVILTGYSGVYDWLELFTSGGQARVAALSQPEKWGLFPHGYLVPVDAYAASYGGFKSPYFDHAAAQWLSEAQVPWFKDDMICLRVVEIAMGF
ncbi:Hypothetical protein PENO1_090780 [Penicillium occitanis (nom. inval.)]|nr:Hypothetical protein PENO1_090780 [Penicillium occitanis (nom. inval.)]PCG92424.1 hypothetical protein PENOC_092580 [Penicillium occitanis (nom. inval.)]